jgi:hypothetical protein
MMPLISKRSSTLVVMNLTLGLASAARAQVIPQHLGSANPISEGFTPVAFGQFATTSALNNDQGFSAWSIAGPGPTSLFYYHSQGLSFDQFNAIANQGCTLTANFRMAQGPTFAPNSEFSAFVEMAPNVSSQQYGIYLGLNASGDTVVVLPTSITQNGDGSFSAPGSTVTVPGHGYHLFQLFYHPATQLADLSVDGVTALQDYAGGTHFISVGAVAFGEVSGGTDNYNLVQLAIGVPETTSLMLVGSVAGPLAMAIRRKRFRGPNYSSRLHRAGSEA